jgi:ABC-type transport system substrate-binding protein
MKEEEMFSKSLKGLALLAVLLLVLASLVSCGQEEEEPVAPAETVEEAAPAETVEEEAPAETVEEEAPAETVEEEAPAETVAEEAPTEEPAPEEETSVVMIFWADPSGFNSLVTDTGWEQTLMELVLVGLVDIDPWGEWYLELATDIPTVENGGVVIDEDAWTMDVTWSLRDDVYWADGEPVTADDVIFTWNAIADPETGIWAEGLD